MKLTIVRSKEAYLAAQQKHVQPPIAPGTERADDEFGSVKRWESTLDLGAPGAKKFKEVKDDAGSIIDYRDVEIEGYLSTFESVTEADRDGDRVKAGAFAETIKEFMSNPVLLVDHLNMVSHLAGNFTSVKEDRHGLAIKARVTNSPEMRDVRFKIAEGFLKAMSMGGIFYYEEDRRTIFKVKLWEGSLVSIPANQDALFEVRSLNDSEKKFLKSGKGFPDYYTFLRAQQLQTQTEVAA